MPDDLPLRAQREALRLQTLVDGCRHALRNTKSLSRWLADHQHELLLLLSEGSRQDAAVITALRQRREFRRAVHAAAKIAWSNASSHPDPTAIHLTVELALTDKPRITPEFNSM